MYSQRIYCLVPRRGAPFWAPNRREHPLRRRAPPVFTKWSKKTTIALFSCLDLPSEQQLVIKLTSQQARALALASRCIVVHWGGNSFFERIPGQKAGLAWTRPYSLGVEEWEQKQCCCVSPCESNCSKDNLLIPGSREGQRQICFLSFDVVPLSRHIHPKDTTVVHAKASNHWWGCDTFPCAKAEAFLAWAIGLCVVHLLKGSVL